MSGDIEASWVRLELTSRPESARLVRSMSTAAGGALGFDPELLSDVNTAVTEACNNVIQHAYGDLPGPFSVELAATRSGIELRVRDRGRGIRAGVPDDGLKVGFALMSALAERAEFINAPDGGTEVRLGFRSPARAGPTMSRGEFDERHSSAGQAEVRAGLTGDVVLTVAPVGLLAPVLGCTGRALAPSAGFSLQRCSDVYRLSDLLAAHAERSAVGTAISAALGAHNQRLEFALAPLRIGTSADLEQARADEAIAMLASLTEDVTFSALDDHETLRVSMRDHLRA